MPVGCTPPTLPQSNTIGASFNRMNVVVTVLAAMRDWATKHETVATSTSAQATFAYSTECGLDGNTDRTPAALLFWGVPPFRPLLWPFGGWPLVLLLPQLSMDDKDFVDESSRAVECVTRAGDPPWSNC